MKAIEETLVYTLQGNLAPVHTGALFEFVFNVFNRKKINSKTIYHFQNESIE
jgi:hypothetical protein